MASKTPVCRNIMNFGKCNYEKTSGKPCSFSHPKVCFKYIKKPSLCEYGNSCHYIHPRNIHKQKEQPSVNSKAKYAVKSKPEVTSGNSSSSSSMSLVSSSSRSLKEIVVFPEEIITRPDSHNGLSDEIVVIPEEIIRRPHEFQRLSDENEELIIQIINIKRKLKNLSRITEENITDTSSYETTLLQVISVLNSIVK